MRRIRFVLAGEPALAIHERTLNDLVEDRK
jgi:hypothetical protein